MDFSASPAADFTVDEAETPVAVDPALTRHELRAAEYRTMASDAKRSAEGTQLPQVREKFERAAKVWADLASADEARARGLATRFPPAASRAAQR